MVRMGVKGCLFYVFTYPEGTLHARAIESLIAPKTDEKKKKKSPFNERTDTRHAQRATTLNTWQ